MTPESWSPNVSWNPRLRRPSSISLEDKLVSNQLTLSEIHVWELRILVGIRDSLRRAYGKLFP